MGIAKQATEPSGKSQLDKFKDAARELECDDDEAAFTERLGGIIKGNAHPPSSD